MRQIQSKLFSENVFNVETAAQAALYHICELFCRSAAPSSLSERIPLGDKRQRRIVKLYISVVKNLLEYGNKFALVGT